MKFCLVNVNSGSHVTVPRSKVLKQKPRQQSHFSCQSNVQGVSKLSILLPAYPLPAWPLLCYCRHAPLPLLQVCYSATLSLSTYDYKRLRSGSGSHTIDVIDPLPWCQRRPTACTGRDGEDSCRTRSIEKDSGARPLSIGQELASIPGAAVVQWRLGILMGFSFNRHSLSICRCRSTWFLVAASVSTTASAATIASESTTAATTSTTSAFAVRGAATS